MREFALRLGRGYAAALLARHAAHRRALGDGERAARAAGRYARRWLDAAPLWPPDEGADRRSPSLSSADAP
jgi:hypothetical protein